MTAAQRIVFGSGVRGGHQLLPEVLEIGRGRFPEADRGHLRPHVHKGAFEICFIISGEVEWGTDKSWDILRTGDLYLTAPGEAHWGRDATMHPCALYWLILGAPEHGYAWPGLDPALIKLLEQTLAGPRSHRLRGTDSLQQAFEYLFQDHALPIADASDQLLRVGSARAKLQSLIVEVARIVRLDIGSQRRTDGASCVATSVERIMVMIRDEGCNADTIRRVCRENGYDYDKLNRDFVDNIGISVAQYWLRERIRLARERLHGSSMSITDIAMEMGFSSSQHFATAFRKMTGMTPSEYRLACPADGAL